MSEFEAPTGRYNQRARTRADIVKAAVELLRGGHTPSMAQIAAAAKVSRRTLYLHFSTLEQLLTDAQIGLLSEQAIDRAIDLADPGGDIETRVAAMIGAIIENSRETLPLGRSLIKLTIESAGSNPGTPRRGYRRVAWIEKALEPARAKLTKSEFKRLVSALSVVVGWEGLIVLSDVRALDESAQREVITWAARAILRAALQTARRGR